MTLEQQYPSPERCEKLDELGFPYDTTFFMRVMDHAIVLVPRGKTFVKGDYYPAPSVPEMLELMKEDIQIQDIGLFTVRIELNGKYWLVSYVDNSYGEFYYKSFKNESLANAVADCLIWLIENNFISFTEKKNG